MKGYSIEEIVKIIRGKSLQKAEAPLIKHIVLDSRKLNYSEQSIFFALKGSRRDGHQFIQELYEKGVRNFVVSDEALAKADGALKLANANVIKVKDTLTALQSLAAHHRKQFDI